MPEPLTTAPNPPQAAFDGLLSLAEQTDVLALLEDLTDADRQPEVGTKPGQPLSASGSPSEIHLSDDEKKILVRECCDLVEEYRSAAREKDETEQEIRDSYLQRPDNQQSGAGMGSAEQVSELSFSQIDQAAARLTTNILGADPLIVVDPVAASYGISPQSIDQLAKDAQAFLNPYVMEEMDFEHLLPTALLRTAKVGNAVFYLRWEEERRVRYEWARDSSTPVRKEDRIGNVTAKLLDNQNVFLWPPTIPNWQRGYQIVGHEETLTPAAWRALVATYKISDDVVRIIESTPPESDSPENREAERHGVAAGSLPDRKLLRPVTIAEAWCHMALPGKIEPDKFQILFHRPTRTCIWVGYNANHTQKHPYHPLRYKWSDNFAWALGIGHEVFQNQSADTVLWNLELDNLMAGAYWAILRRAGSLYNTQTNDLRPGGEIVVDDVEKDFKSVKLGGEAPEIGTSRAANRSSAAAASGLSSVMFGQGDPTMKSGAGTGSTLALIEQGNKKLQQIDSNLRVDLTAIYEYILEQVVQYGQDGIYYRKVDEETAARLKVYLYQPPRGNISRMFRFRAQAPSAASSDEARKQAYMLLWNFALEHSKVVSAYVERVLAAENPAALPRWYRETAVFLSHITKKIAEFVELPGAARLVPEIPDMTPQDAQINRLAQENGTLQQQLQQAQQMLAAYAQQGMQMTQPGGEQATQPPAGMMDMVGGMGGGMSMDQMPPNGGGGYGNAVA